MKNPENAVGWVVREMSCDDFLLEMLSLGKPIETSLVGVFETGSKIRGSLKETELPLHRDGEYSAMLAEAQGGTYVEREGINYVGIYCFRDDIPDCFTILEHLYEGELVTHKIQLVKGEALIFDNRIVRHGRTGLVGKRLCLRVWIGEPHEDNS